MRKMVVPFNKEVKEINLVSQDFTSAKHDLKLTIPNDGNYKLYIRENLAEDQKLTITFPNCIVFNDVENAIHSLNGAQNGIALNVANSTLYGDEIVLSFDLPSNHKVNSNTIGFSVYQGIIHGYTESQHINSGVLSVPSENNLVFDAQFVADELVANNIEPGYYAVNLIDTSGGVDIVHNMHMIVKAEDMLLKSNVCYDETNDDAFVLLGNYSASTKNLTFSLYSPSATITASNYHIDLFKIG